MYAAVGAGVGFSAYFGGATYDTAILGDVVGWRVLGGSVASTIVGAVDGGAGIPDLTGERDGNNVSVAGGCGIEASGEVVGSLVKGDSVDLVGGDEGELVAGVLDGIAVGAAVV